MREGIDQRATWALAAFCFLVQIPFLRRGISPLDEGSMLAIADALYQGEALYRDRVTQLGPVSYELLAALFHLFGPSVLVGRIVQALVLCGSVVLVYVMLRDLLGWRWALGGAALVLAVKTLGFPYWTLYNYAPIGLLFCLAAAAAVMRFLPEHRLGWLALGGIGIGVAFVTKQNLGALLGFATAITVFADWLRDGDRAIPALTGRAAVLAAGTLGPILVVIGAYGAGGTLGDLVEWTVVGLMHMGQPYQIPFPGLTAWWSQPESIGEIAFTYFPAPLLLLSWQGGLDMSSRAVVLLLEIFVKATYFLPLFLVAGGVVSLWRGDGSSLPRAAWSQQLLLILAGAACYGSVLARGRTDWVHLMTVQPALVLLCVAVVGQWARSVRWRSALSLWVGGIWLAAGLAIGAAIFAVYRVPVESPRGDLLASPTTARNSNRLLRYLDTRPPDERILILRAQPIHYFLSGRRIPGRFDLLMPGVIGPPENDALIAESLSDVDRVIYDPKPFPTIPVPITEYAPLTSETLASRFQIDEIVSEKAFVLKRADTGPPETVAVDIWRDFDRFSKSRRAQRDSWMVYRILAADLESGGEPVCVTVPHAVAPGDWIATTPITLPPPFWGGGNAPAARFRVDLRDGTRAETLYEASVTVDPPGERLRIPLSSVAGRQVEIDFCISALHAPVRAGWARPRIVRTDG
ncbi:MAG: glycosyltransferase family 39 protein [Proteobacteria bacterium]|nr:glycosyltransferase family 39 protein [Pseudomonadota bacterium]